MRFFSLLSFLPTDRREEREIIPVQRSSLASQQKYALSGGSTVYESTHAVVISLTRNVTVDTFVHIQLPSSLPRGVARDTGVDTLRVVIASLHVRRSFLDFTGHCLKSEFTGCRSLMTTRRPFPRFHERERIYVGNRENDTKESIDGYRLPPVRC